MRRPLSYVMLALAVLAVMCCCTASAADTFKPIRIGVFFDNLYDETRYCTSATGSVLDYGTVSRNCTADNVLTDAKRDMLINSITPAAVELLEKRFKVKRLTDPITALQYSTNTRCGAVTIPDAHRTAGVSGYDLILYVMSKPNEEGVGSWTMTCGRTGDSDGRTIVAVINFGADEITGVSDTDVRSMAHSMLAAFGFEQGYFDKKNMLATRTVRGKADTPVVLAGAKLKAAIAEQFGCSNAEYLPLERSLKSTWEVRSMKWDIMATSPEVGYISAITMAALEDTGAYQGVYDKAEISPWGRGAGCAFLDQPCLTDGVALPNTKFCANKDDFNYHCNPNRTGLGRCVKERAPSNVSWASGYGQWSTEWELDYCPTYSKWSWALRCSVDNDIVFDSVDGSSSKCLDASKASKGVYTTEGVCAAVRCNADSYDVQLKYGTWTACPDGTTLTMPSETGVTRTITCPPMYEVCYVGRDVVGSASSRVGSVSVSLIVALCAALVSIWATV